MNEWIILGAAGVAVIPVCLIAAALCVAARIGDDLAEHAHRDEAISQIELYPTEQRDVRASVITYMRAGLTADDAVARTQERRP